jgi:hypothetical protein
VKPVFFGILLSLGILVFSQSPEKALARSFSQKGYELLNQKQDPHASRFFAETALEFYQNDPLALYVLSRTEPEDWHKALERAQAALRSYQNLIRNPHALEGSSSALVYPSLKDELVAWIGSLLYRLGYYQEYQGLEESYPQSDAPSRKPLAGDNAPSKERAGCSSCFEGSLGFIPF